MKIKVYNPNNLPTISHNQLENLQGDLKEITEESLRKLCNSIIENGIFVPKFVWINEGKYYIIDGHQTKKALIQLETDGYEVPEIPYVLIDAKNKQDASKKLLQIISRYGSINEMTTFFEENAVEIGYIENIEIPELEVLKEITEEDYGDIDSEMDDMEGEDFVTIRIMVPRKHQEAVLDWLADGGETTSVAIGESILRKCELL